ncbi:MULTISPECIES: hypothetical protein [Levilactobacillus]|uniref:hypothetical protein n=1 Tax=Levilactobacillus TaxID=2767886 RepID=UPI001951BD38|nr:hypothetical protein [Levilactobacillus sp. 244-2]
MVNQKIRDRNISREFSQQGRQVFIFGGSLNDRINLVANNLTTLEQRYGTTSMQIDGTPLMTDKEFIANVTKLEAVPPFSEQGVDAFNLLARNLLESNMILVIRELAIAQSTSLRIRLAEMAKSMSDDAINYENSYAKVIFTGPTDVVQQMWQDVPSLKSRMATISV